VGPGVLGPAAGFGYRGRVSENPPKRGTVADAEAHAGSDAAQARVREWWHLLPRVLTRPNDVFDALQEDDETDVEARSEPILLVVLVAGMAGILLTPAWGTLLDDQSLDWLVIAVITFIGGLFYGTAGYFLLGIVVWAGAHAVGFDLRRRAARQLVAFCALPFALSFLITVPVVAIGFGYDWFRTGGSDDGVGRALVLGAAAILALWSLALLTLGLRRTFGLPWRAVAGALALAAVIVAAIGVVPTVL
jgi:hypothetical protein